MSDIEAALSTEVFQNDPVANRQVVIMAGGAGRRLRPLTETCPKPLLSINGQPLLRHTVRMLEQQGFRRFHICLHYQPEAFHSVFGDGSGLGVQIEYIEETSPMGTAGAIGLLPSVPEEAFVVFNADVFATLDCTRLLEFHDRSGADATVCVTWNEMSVPFGVVTTRNERLETLVERPKLSHFVNAGIYAIEPRVLELVPRDQPLDMSTLIQRLLASDRPVASFEIKGTWIDVGRPEDLDRARRLLL